MTSTSPSIRLLRVPSLISHEKLGPPELTSDCARAVTSARAVKNCPMSARVLVAPTILLKLVIGVPAMVMPALL